MSTTYPRETTDEIYEEIVISRPDQPGVKSKRNAFRVTNRLLETISASGILVGLLGARSWRLGRMPVISGISCVAGLAIGLATWYAKWKFDKIRLIEYDPAARSAANMLLRSTEIREEVEELDETLIKVTEERPESVVRPGKKTAFVRAMAYSLIGTIGILANTKANRIIVSDHARKMMEEHGLRPMHIGMHLPIVIEAYFFPSEESIALRRAVIFKETQKRLNDARIQPISGFLNWVFRRPVLENAPMPD